MCRFRGLQWGAGLPGELPGRRGPGTEHRGVHRLSWPEGGGSGEVQGPPSEPASPEIPSLSGHTSVLPATPCGSPWPTVLQHSAPLHRRSAPLQEGHLLLPPPPLAVTIHRSSLQGVGTPELDTPHRGPTAQPAGQTHGRKQDPGAPRWAVCQGPLQLLQGQCKLGVQLFRGP